MVMLTTVLNIGSCLEGTICSLLHAHFISSISALSTPSTIYQSDRHRTTHDTENDYSDNGLALDGLTIGEIEDEYRAEPNNAIVGSRHRRYLRLLETS